MPTPTLTPPPTPRKALDLNHLTWEDIKMIDWAELWRNRYYLFIAIGLGLSAILIFFFAFVPQIQKVVEGIDAYQHERETLKQLQLKIGTLEQVHQLAEYQAHTRVDELLPDKKPLLELLTSVNTAAQAAGVAVTDIETSPGKLASESAKVKITADASNPLGSSSIQANQPAETTVQPTNKQDSTAVALAKLGIQPLMIKVTVRGTLAAVNAFFDQVERSAPMTNVSKVELTATDAKTGAATTSLAGDQFSADLTLNTYYFTKIITSTLSAPLPPIGAKERAFLQQLTNFSPSTSSSTSPTQVQGGGVQDLFGVGKSATTPNVIPSPTP